MTARIAKRKVAPPFWNFGRARVLKKKGNLLKETVCRGTKRAAPRA
jgi:hypothetical protein